MKFMSRIAPAVLILLVLASPAFAQSNLEGTWDVQASGVLPTEQEPCVFEGSAELVQSGDQVSGTAILMLVSGPDVCPVEVTGDVMGVVEGSSFFGMVHAGQLGIADFTGTIGQDGASIEGVYAITEGPFAGASGVWSAAVPEPPTPAPESVPVPTLGAWGLSLLATLLALTILLVLRRPWA